MRVRFTQSGGLMGLTKRCGLDTDEMPVDEGRELTRLVHDAGVTGEVRVRSEKGRDLQEYEVVVDDGGQRALLACDDLTVPPAAGPLLRFLKPLARPVPPGED